MVSSISWQKKELSNSSHACNWGSNCGFPGSFPSLLVFHETLCECGICVFCSSPCVWKPHSKAGFSGWKADAKMECLPQQVVLGQSHSRKRHSKNLNAIHHCSFLYSILYVSQSITPSESQNAMFFVCQVAPLHQRNKALIAAIHAGGHDFKLLPQLLGAKVQIGRSPSGGLEV